MKVTLASGKSFEVEGVHGRSINYQGVVRDSLIFIFDPKTTTIEEVLSEFNAEACSTVVLKSEDGSSHIHEDYTIRIEVGCGYKDMILSGGTVGKNLDQSIYVRMAQTTLAERSIQQQQEIIDSLIVALLEG